ncbi:hypothetical protein TrVFT333_002243 [Trichoderma virens FT-333]|nr:hypothetical protein TrVFT333_002243 [Trichoderma virens FT-333]
MASNDAGRSVSHSSFSGPAHIFQGDVNISKAKINIDVHDTESDAILSNLPVVEGAAFDAHANEHEPRCHPGTRVKILEEIVKWAQDPHRKRIYWLCGMAGTGKSTICRTVAHDLSNLNITAASFFFKKGDGDRDKSGALFTTIVKQLVEYLPKEMAIHVKQALRENPSISDKSLSKQFEELILAPLKRCKSLPPVIVFVLDALDECDNQANAARIIELLPNVETVSSTSFKVLVSSRPECHLRKSFAQLNCKYEEILLQMTLHEVADEDVRRDIFIFLESQLRHIRDSYNDTNLQLPAYWPSQSLVEDLVDMSMPLFIMAATACRFIGDEDLGVPVTLAQEFLHHRKFGKGNPLARTYLPILEQLLVKRNGTRVEDRSKVEKERIIGEFRRVVGTIVLLEEPLSIISLSNLLEMDSWEIVKLFHLSFRDFLTGADHQEEKHDFFVDERETHASISRQCVALLSKDDNLKQDICKLSHPGTLRSDIDQDTIDSCLPPHVRYACLYWVFHLKKGGGHINDADETYRFLTKHLIHWLEALSLLGCIGDSHDMVDTLLTMVDDNEDSASLLRDTKQFIRTYQHIIDKVPLQLYSSALIFAPMKSIFRQCFENEIPRWIKNRPAVETNWDSLLQVLEHNEPVEQAVISPDSSVIASLSSKKVAIWRSHTGNCVHELKFDSSATIATAIEFSCDSKLLYAAFSNGEVTSWETDAWTCSTVIGTDKQLDANVFDMAFSPDCKLLAMAFAERIEIRSIPSGGDLIERIIINDARRLMFSPDSTYLSARVIRDQAFRMWLVYGGQLIWIKECLALAYSPGSSFVALSVEQAIGYAIEIHRVGEGSLTLYRKFPLDDGLGRADCLAFSHDAALLAVGRVFRKIEIRLADTGKCIWAANAHTSHTSSLSFSHDSTRLVSSSDDGTVHIYSVDKHRSARIPESERGTVGSITISPDSSLILLKPGGDNTIWQVFQTASSACLREIDRRMVQSDPAFTPGSALAMIKDGAAEIWHPDRHPRIQNLEGLGSEPYDIRASCSSTDFTLAAGLLNNGSLRIWRMDTGACIRAVKSAVQHISIDFWFLRFSPDASHIACGSYEGNKLLVWQVNSVTRAQKFNLSQGLRCFALSNTKLAMASANSVEIWSLKTGEFLLRFVDTNQHLLYKLTISCDSTLLASTLHSLKPNITIWNAHTGTPMVAIRLSYPITHFTFEPNSSSLLTDVGRIKFKNPIASSAVIAKDSQSQPWYHDGLGFCNDDSLDYGSWISFNGKKLIWLPMKYRGDRRISRAVSESVIAIVPQFGRNAFIEFDTEWISSEYSNT